MRLRPKALGPQFIHLELPGGSHHDDEIHVGVDGRAHPCIVVHKLLGGHLQGRVRDRNETWLHRFGGAQLQDLPMEGTFPSGAEERL